MRKIRNPLKEVAQPGLEIFQAEFLASRILELQELSLVDGHLNFALIKKYAHQWKGFASPYGFQELELQALKLNEAAERADEGLCLSIIKEIKDYLG